MSTVKLSVLPIVGLMILALLQIGFAQTMAPSLAPEAPSNDGKSIDQGVAYVLLVVALAITYLVH